MSDTFQINAEVRDDMGKGASRRLRRQADQIPAILYGGGKAPAPLTMARKDLEHALENEAFYSHVLTINIGKSREKAVLKDLQRHPAMARVMHADFMRVSDDVKIKVNVPLHFLNEANCHGVKQEGGIIQHTATDIEVLCLPGDMPEYVEVDMLDIAIGDIIHIADLELPGGVESVALNQSEDNNLAIASVLAPKGGIDEEIEEELEAAAAADKADADDEQADDAPAEDGEQKGE